MIFHHLLKCIGKDKPCEIDVMEMKSIVNKALRFQGKLGQLLFSVYKLNDHGISMYTQCIFGDNGDAEVKNISPKLISEKDFNYLIKVHEISREINPPMIAAKEVFRTDISLGFYL